MGSGEVSRSGAGVDGLAGGVATRGLAEGQERGRGTAPAKENQRVNLRTEYLRKREVLAYNRVLLL